MASPPFLPVTFTETACQGTAGARGPEDDAAVRAPSSGGEGPSGGGAGLGLIFHLSQQLSSNLIFKYPFLSPYCVMG